MQMMKTILSNLLKKYSTRLHPVEQRVLPDGFRGRFKFDTNKCIMCRMCAIKCPTKVIRIDPEQGIWEREVMGCLYCGVCADVCPTGCIIMTNVYRPPIMEPTSLRVNVKPRVKKSATPQEGEISAALERKVAEVAADNGISTPQAEAKPALAAKAEKEEKPTPANAEKKQDKAPTAKKKDK